MAEEPLVVVYQARNLVNGKRYIGVTKRGLRDRKYRHLRDINKYDGLFQRALRKYGAENFVFEVLVDFEGDEDLARVYEWEMISKHKPEYNLSAGGEGGTASESTRAKISARHLGRKNSAETRAAMSEAQRRRAAETPPSVETREKMRQAKLGRRATPEQLAARIGRKVSEETRKKMSAAQMGRPPTKGRTGIPVSAEMRAKISQTLKQAEWVDTPNRIAARARVGTSRAIAARKIPIVCVNDGNVFESVKRAAEFYGLPYVELARAVREQREFRGKRFKHQPKATPG